jgi:hypothetical protein
MDEKLILAIIGFCGTLIGLIVWIVKRLFKSNEANTERSIKAIENNTSVLNEIKRFMENNK